jgi:hypothetical protein
MRLPSKSVSLVLALLFLCAALVPYSHCSAGESPFHEGELNGHSHDINEHASDCCDLHHFHFLIEAGTSTSRSRLDAESAKSPENSTAVIESFYSPYACIVACRTADFSDLILLTQFQPIPKGLSPPF